MLFIALVLFSAFLIEGIGTYVSVIGLSALFAANPVIITLAVALDLGKVVAVSFLYKYWKKIGLLMRSYMIVATAVLMLITSTGCFGYLSGQFQHAIAGTHQDTVLIQSLENEQTRLQARKQEIDKQIANLPADYAKARRDLMKEFAPETQKINARLAEIDQELPKLKVESIHKNTEVGPILYVAEAFNTTPEQAVKWVILIIIFVFDPLAITLLIAGNFLIEQRRLKKEQSTPKSTFPNDVTAYDPTSQQEDFYFPSQPAGGVKVEVPEEVPMAHLSDDELTEHLGRKVPVDIDGDGIPDITVETPPEAQELDENVRVALPSEREIITMKNLKPQKSALENVDGRTADVQIDPNGGVRTTTGHVYSSSLNRVK